MVGPRDWSPRKWQFVLKTELAMAGDIIDWMPEEQECFVIEITPEYAKVLLGRLTIFKNAAFSDLDLLEMYFWDASGEYYGIDWDKTENEFDEKGREIVVPDGTKPGRTEIDQVVIRANGVFWTAMPKHSSVYIITAPIQWDEIKRIATGKKVKE